MRSQADRRARLPHVQDESPAPPQGRSARRPLSRPLMTAEGTAPVAGGGVRRDPAAGDGRGAYSPELCLRG